MVDWSLAHQVARFAAGGDRPHPDAAAGLVELSGQLEAEVAGYTGLRPEGAVPRAELVGRAEWAEINVDGLADLLEPVAARLEQRLGAAGPLAGALRLGARATLATEAGLVMGYMSQRVLGQYELSLLQPEAPARLLYVAPNVERAVHDLRVDRDSFLGWLALHELTHAFQFQGVTWLRGHLGDLLRGYLRTVEVRIDSGAAGGLPSLPDLGRIVESFREGGLAALVQTREQRDRMASIQATMAVVEGYCDHVMDALGARLLPVFEGLREAMESRRRSRSAPERMLQRLLGLDLKLRQYELGRTFCDAVVERAGIEGLNRVWDDPDALPTGAELRHPERWLGRSGLAVAAA